MTRKGTAKVSRMPVRQLWDATGLIANERVGELSKAQVIALLERDALLVVLSIGALPIWYAGSEADKFWTVVACGRLAGGADVDLDEYPDGYCYYAEEWKSVSGKPVIALSVLH